MSMAEVFGGATAPPITQEQVLALIAQATDPEKLGKKLTEHRELVTAKVDLHTMLAEAIGEKHRTSNVVRHVDPAHKVSIDQNMTYDRAQVILAGEQEAAERLQRYVYQIPVRWEDGAVALMHVLEDIYGASGIGIERFSLFGGRESPVKLDVCIGLTMNDEGEVVKLTKSVPATEFKFAPLDCDIEWTQWEQGDETGLFMLAVKIKTENEASAKYIARKIEEHIAEFSIYKGQILRYEPNPDNPREYELVHTMLTDDPSIVYSKIAARRLHDEVIGKMTKQEKLAAFGRKTTFRVLIWGPLGTGKTCFLIKVALTARACGRTVILYTPRNGVSANELVRINKVATRLAGKFGSVVLTEDTDQFYPVGTHELSLLTNLFDGLDKEAKVSYVMTTNHLDKIEPEILRIPRITGTIEVAQLDRESIELMLKLTLGNKLADDIDFDQVWEIVEPFSPSFIRNSFDKAFDLAVQDDRDTELITTENLVGAALSLVEQHRMQRKLEDQKAGVKPDHLTLWLKGVLRKVFRSGVVLEN